MNQTETRPQAQQVLLDIYRKMPTTVKAKRIFEVYQTGKWLAMDFVEYIRRQQRFGTEKALSAQIAKDCEKAREILPRC